MQKKDNSTVQKLEKLLKERLQLEDLELNVEQMRSICTKGAEKQLFNELEIKYKDAQFYQEKLKALIDNTTAGELDDEHIEEFKSVVESLKVSTTANFQEIRQLQSIQILPSWVESLYTFFQQSSSATTNSSSSQQRGEAQKKEKFVNMIKYISNACDKLDANSLTERQHTALREWVDKTPSILDRALKSLQEKVRLIVWINEAFTVMKKSTVSITDLEKLMNEVLLDSQVSAFKDLRHKYHHIKPAIEAMYKQSVDWLKEAAQLETSAEEARLKFQKSLNETTIVEEKKSSKAMLIESNSITDIKDKCAKFFQLVGENQDQIEELNKAFKKLENLIRTLTWLQDCHDYLQSKERKLISDINNLFKTSETLGISEQFSIVKRKINQLYEKTQSFLRKYEEFQRGMDRHSSESHFTTQSSSTEEEPYFQSFELNKNKIPLEEMVQLFKELNSCNTTIVVDQMMEKIHPQLQRCNDVWIHFKKLHEIYEEKLINISLLGNWTRDDATMKIIGLEISDMNQRLIQLPFNLGSQERDILRFEWIYFTLALNCGFVKRNLDFWQQSLSLAKTFETPIVQFEEKLSNEIFAFTQIESSTEELKRAEKQSKDKRAKEAKNMRTYSDILSLQRSIGICPIENPTITAYVKSQIEKAEQLRSQYKTTFVSSSTSSSSTKQGSRAPTVSKFPLKTYRDMLDKIRSSVKSFTLEEEFMIEETITSAEEIVRTIKSLKKKKNDFESQKQIIEAINRYKVLRVENAEAEKLMADISTSEDALTPIEMRLFDLECEIEYEETIEIKRKLEQCRKEYPESRILRIESELFVRKIRLLQKYWEEGGDVYGVTLEGMQNYLEFAQEYKGVKETKDRLDRAIQFIQIVISDCEEKISEFRGQKVQVLKKILSSSTRLLGFVDLSEEIQKIIDKKNGGRSKSQVVMEMEDDLGDFDSNKHHTHKSSRNSSFVRGSSHSERGQIKSSHLKKELNEKIAKYGNKNYPIDSESEQELKQARIQEQRKREHLNQKIQAKAKIVNRLVKGMESNAFFKQNCQIDKLVEYGKRLCEKIFKNNSDKIVESTLISKKIRKTFERLGKFAEVSRKLEAEKFSYKLLIRYTHASDEMLGELNKKLILDFCFQDKYIEDDHYVIQQKTKVQPLKERLFDFDDLLTTPAAPTSDKFEGEKIFKKMKKNSNDAVSSQVRNTATAGHIDTKKQPYNPEPFQKRKYYSDKFSDEEDNTTKPENTPKVSYQNIDLQTTSVEHLGPIDQAELYNAPGLKQKLIQYGRQNMTSNQHKESQEILYNPEEQEDKNERTQSVQNWEVFSGPIDVKEIDEFPVSLRTQNSYVTINQLPAFGQNTLESEGLIRVDSFYDYLEKSLQNSHSSDRRRKIFVTGWVDTSDSSVRNGPLETFANNLYQHERAAVFLWHEHCQLYMMHANDLTSQLQELLRFQLQDTGSSESPKVVFIFIFKEVFDHVYIERLVPKPADQAVPNTQVQVSPPHTEESQNHNTQETDILDSIFNKYTNQKQNTQKQNQTENQPAATSNAINIEEDQKITKPVSQKSTMEEDKNQLPALDNNLSNENEKEKKPFSTFKQNYERKPQLPGIRIYDFEWQHKKYSSRTPIEQKYDQKSKETNLLDLLINTDESSFDDTDRGSFTYKKEFRNTKPYNSSYNNNKFSNYNGTSSTYNKGYNTYKQPSYGNTYQDREESSAVSDTDYNTNNRIINNRSRYLPGPAGSSETSTYKPKFSTISQDFTSTTQDFKTSTTTKDFRSNTYNKTSTPINTGRGFSRDRSNDSTTKHSEFQTNKNFNQFSSSSNRQFSGSSGNIETEQNNGASDYQNRSASASRNNTHRSQSRDERSRKGSFNQEKSLNSSRSSTPYRSLSNNEQRNQSEESGIVNSTDLTDILKNLNETLNMLADKPRSVAQPFVAPVAPPQQNYYDSNEYYAQQSGPAYNSASYGNYTYPNNNNSYYPPPAQQQPNNTANNNSYSSELLTLLQQQQEQINHLQKNTITKDFTNNNNNNFKSSVKQTNQNFSSTTNNSKPFYNNNNNNNSNNNGFSNNNTNSNSYNNNNGGYTNTFSGNQSTNKFKHSMNKDSGDGNGNWNSSWNNNNNGNNNFNRFKGNNREQSQQRDGNETYTPNILVHNNYTSDQYQQPLNNKAKKSNKEVIKAVDQIRNIQQQFSNNSSQEMNTNQKIPINSQRYSARSISNNSDRSSFQQNKVGSHTPNPAQALSKLVELNNKNPQFSTDKGYLGGVGANDATPHKFSDKFFNNTSTNNNFNRQTTVAPQEFKTPSVNSISVANTMKNPYGEPSGRVSTSKLGSLIQAHQKSHSQESNSAHNTGNNSNNNYSNNNSFQQQQQQQQGGSHSNWNNNQFYNDQQTNNRNNNNNFTTTSNSSYNTNSNSSLISTKVKMNDYTNNNNFNMNKNQQAFKVDDGIKAQSMNELNNHFINAKNSMQMPNNNFQNFNNRTNMVDENFGQQSSGGTLSSFKYSTTKMR